jgi:hypothetical protein
LTAWILLTAILFRELLAAWILLRVLLIRSGVLEATTPRATKLLVIFSVISPTCD